MSHSNLYATTLSLPYTTHVKVRITSTIGSHLAKQASDREQLGHAAVCNLQMTQDSQQHNFRAISLQFPVKVEVQRSNSCVLNQKLGPRTQTA